MKNKLKEISQKEGFKILDSEQSQEIQEEEIVNIDIKKNKKSNRKIVVEKVQQKKTSPEKQKDEFPGVLNVEKELQRQKREQLEKEKGATVVIQKWTRGFLGRTKAQRLRESMRKRIEEEYDYFQD